MVDTRYLNIIINYFKTYARQLQGHVRGQIWRHQQFISISLRSSVLKSQSKKLVFPFFDWYFSLTSSLQSMPNCLILFEFKSNSIFCFGNQFKYNSVHLISETNGCFNVQKHFFFTEEFFVILWFVWINVKNK